MGVGVVQKASNCITGGICRISMKQVNAYVIWEEVDVQSVSIVMKTCSM